MLNNAVSIGNMTAGRMIADMLNMCLDHPFVLCLLLSAMAGGACAVLLDMVGACLAAPPRPALVRTPQTVRIRRA